MTFGIHEKKTGVRDILDSETKPQELNTPVCFFQTYKDYGCFSNFSKHPVHLDGLVWPTAEHYYQAQKFWETDKEWAMQIHQAKTAKEAATKGRLEEKQHLVRPDWAQVKESIMKRALISKFTVNPEIKYKLLSTGTRPIEETSPRDYYWGTGIDHSGLNRLGLLLMEVRDELRASGKNFLA